MALGIGLLIFLMFLFLNLLMGVFLFNENLTLLASMYYTCALSLFYFVTINVIVYYILEVLKQIIYFIGKIKK